MNFTPVYFPQDPLYRIAVADLWDSEAVQSMAAYPQHGDTNCLMHSVRVSYLSYIRALALGRDARAAARGGLLHDLFLYDWHEYHRPKWWSLPHGFMHPRIALENASRLFELTLVERDVILHHMWPLTPFPPLTAEGWIVTRVDKYVSLQETFRRPVFLPECARG